MKRIQKQIKTLLVALFVIAIGSVQVEAASDVTVKNETGYYLQEVKYVQLVGKVKKLVGRTQLANGKSHSFRLTSSGNYIVYISFMRGNQKLYGKGKSYYIKDGTKGMLTLHKVVFNEKGSSINFVNKSEFDAIK